MLSFLDGCRCILVSQKQAIRGVSSIRRIYRGRYVLTVYTHLQGEVHTLKGEAEAANKRNEYFQEEIEALQAEILQMRKSAEESSADLNSTLQVCVLALVTLCEGLRCCK